MSLTQPKTLYWQVPSSVLASLRKLDAPESMQPLSTKMHPERTVALGLKLSVPSSMVHP